MKQMEVHRKDLNLKIYVKHVGLKGMILLNYTYSLLPTELCLEEIVNSASDWGRETIADASSYLRALTDLGLWFPLSSKRMCFPT